MRDEVISDVDAHDMDTSGYQVSKMDDFEFYWENDQLDADVFFTPGIDTRFSLKAFDCLEIGGSVRNTILLNKEEGKIQREFTTHKSSL